MTEFVQIKTTRTVNTKEIIAEIKARLQIDAETSDSLFRGFAEALKKELLANNVVSLQGFGSFEARRKAERISVNPTTKKRMLIPPKQSIAFKPSGTMKEKFNQ